MTIAWKSATNVVCGGPAEEELVYVKKSYLERLESLCQQLEPNPHAPPVLRPWTWDELWDHRNEWFQKGENGIVLRIGGFNLFRALLNGEPYTCRQLCEEWQWFSPDGCRKPCGEYEPKSEVPQ